MIFDSEYRTFLGHRRTHLAGADRRAAGRTDGSAGFDPGSRADPTSAAPDPAAVPGSVRIRAAGRRVIDRRAASG